MQSLITFINTDNTPIALRVILIFVAAYCGYKHQQITKLGSIPYFVSVFMFTYSIGILVKGWFDIVTTLKDI